ncbi:MAG: helix-hairpin-helix domain-containing protein [Acidobacteria bacterium]|nr:helix-hairpin-helix domain-containing protein [Acidobacteriota bacterium]MXZ38136.1 helix-hairpin-helix domain-containing protein [Holophagales bacterium]MYF03658.1 helix-hairpin-helix domain-containing protein [Holophagales bacterium]MYJ24576.1 helix-hairpin-helix domain-containing protein [Holophagales bacterium]
MTRRNRTALLAVALLSLLAALPAIAADGVVNINTADAAALSLLPGVGPSTAGRIVEFRTDNGKFESPADLMLVRGIGERSFERMRPYVTIEGETTLTEKVRIPREETEPAGGSGSDGPSDGP